jgi:Xaa-Pro aminopeptidase
MVPARSISVVLALLFNSIAAQPLAQVQAARFELQQRRDAVLQRVMDGILLVPSRWDTKAPSEPGFTQEPNFFYLTGLERQLGAVLVLDGPRRASMLFVPVTHPRLDVFSPPVVSPNPDSAARLGFAQVSPIDELVAYIDGRLTGLGSVALYVNDATPAAPAIPGLRPFGNTPSAFHEALKTQWPAAVMKSAQTQLDELRSIKSVHEIEATQSAGRAASAALLAGLKALEPMRQQRHVEVLMATACFEHGTGVSWWPWVQTGPNAVFPVPFQTFADYRHLNRQMQTGELARLDVGCEFDHYNSDVGRTAPVSGRWSAAQSETWDLLVGAYRAGLRVLRAGVTVDQVRNAFEAHVRASASTLKYDFTRKAAIVMTDPRLSPHFQIHGVGLEAAEPIGSTLLPGMILAYEPMFSVDGIGFYLEDLLLVTRNGYEVLTPDLPYTATEIELAMRRR